MERQDREYYEGLIDLTSHPKWEMFSDEIKKEIWQIQGSVLETVSTEAQLNYIKGYVAALSATAHLRETASQILDNADEL